MKIKKSNLILTFVSIAYAHLAASQSALFRPIELVTTEASEQPASGNGNSNNNNSSLIWQPLRASFRPINRQQSPPPPPISSVIPPESLALTSSSDPIDSFLTSRFTQPIITTTSTTTTTPAPTISSLATSTLATLNFDDDDLPTRVPLSRFRPTKPPSVDAQASSPLLPFANTSRSHSQTFAQPPPALTQGGAQDAEYRITSECFECICEASTSCNPNSRCQTSDVRHTRCGLFLISYDQWLETGLSKQLVTREALLRDAAADERAFYECVTDRACAENLIKLYMEKNFKDCDKDGRIDCYDVAAIHQSGANNCNGEALLESQYWSDFNACFGFGR